MPPLRSRRSVLTLNAGPSPPGGHPECSSTLGHLSAPVVVAGGDHWAGFRPDRIAALDTTVSA